MTGTPPNIQQSPAVSFCVLKKRSDFLTVARGKRQPTTGMMVQAWKKEEPHIRVGFTCSKKVGNAAVRNRAKRRLREIARDVVPNHGKLGFDYVLIGKANATAQRPYDALKQDLIYALNKLHERFEK